MRLIWKILREHVSIGQLLSFLLANVVGLAIIMMGIQLYVDIAPILSSTTDFLKPEYVVISKPVTTVDTFAGNKPSFSKAEQEELENQSFVNQMGLFRAAQYEVYGRLNMGGNELSSELFFESVPDAFIDVDTKRWRFAPGDEVVPIVIPSDYLSLYNFGYAQSNSMMPVLSEQLVSSVSLDLTLYGRGQSRSLRGEVVGLSNRLNTILVPESFISWSNSELAADTLGWEPSRIILEVNNPTDQGIATYMHEKGYQVANDKLDASKATWFLHLLITIVLIVGLIISALACYILVLSIFLLLQKNTRQMRDLILIGYPRSHIARPYLTMVTLVNILAWLLAAVVTYVVRDAYLPHLQQLATDYSPAAVTYPLLLSGGLIGVIILMNILIILRRVRHI